MAQRAYYDDRDDEEELDIDVCQNCGRYFAWTPHLKAVWRKHWHPGENEQQPQRCERCLVNDTWCEEQD